MAFPETSVLSTFTGTDTNSPVTGFGNLHGAASMYYSNTGTVTVSPGGDSANYWNAATFTQPIDIHAVWAHKGVAAPYVGALLAQSPGATWDGYLVVTNTGGTGVDVYRVDNGDVYGNQLGTRITQNVGAGDQLGMRLNADGSIDVYVKVGAGSWTNIGTRGPDTTYTGEFYAGYLVGEAYDALVVDGQSIDDLSAGEVAVAGGQPLVKRMGGLVGVGTQPQTPWARIW